MKPEIYGFPVAQLTQLPTPFVEAPRFGAALGGPRIFLKRDDTTSLAMGGNKARKLEFLMGDALNRQCDYVITCGGPQSNHARLTAAAARKCGLEPVLVLDGYDPGHRLGNLLLDTLLDAQLVFTEGKPAEVVMENVKADLEQGGHRPYVIPLGGSNPLGTLGYVSCALEIAEQSEARRVRPKALYLAAGSMGTAAGLVLGKMLSGALFDVIGVGVSPGHLEKMARGVDLVVGAASCLKSRLSSGAVVPFSDGLSSVTCESVGPHIRVLGEFVGEAYGVPTREGLEAIHLLARTEGVLTDPVYTGKALAALISHVRAGKYQESDVVVFLHTGGAPADFAYTDYFI